MANQKSDSEIGRVISRFQILDSLTPIGLGHDYKAKDLNSSQIVILKALPKELITSKKIADGLNEIIGTIKAIGHPRIYRIVDVIKEEDSLQYLVLPFVGGSTLEEKLNDNYVFTIDEIIDIAKQIAEGFIAYYSINFSLEFLNTSNIFISEDNNVLIFYFGLSQKGLDQKIENEFPQIVSLMQQNHIKWIGNVIEEMLKKSNTSKIKKKIPEEFNTIIEKCLYKNQLGGYKHMQNLLDDIYSIIPESYKGVHHFNSKSTIQVEKKIAMHRKTIWLLISGIITFIILMAAFYTIAKILQ